MTTIFKGSAVALSTPFTDSGVNFSELERLIEFQISNGTDALLICGTTGEPSTMTMEEQHDVIKFSVEKTAGRIPVIAGVGGNNTAHVVASAKMAQDLGADALLAVTPYYNKCSNAGLVAHFNAVADSTELPIILYNVPGRTGVNICPAVYQELCCHDRIAGIKEASGNISQIVEVARVTNGKASLYSGNDDHVVPLLSLGGMGVISVVANIMPKYMHNMVMRYLEGDVAAACEMQLALNPLANAMFMEVNPIPVKTAMRLMGFEMGPLRLPLTEMSQANADALRACMQKYGLL